jgi:hypothetical protein
MDHLPARSLTLSEDVRNQGIGVRQRTQQVRRIPHLLLVEARENPSSSRLISNSSSYRGRQHSVVAYTPPNENTTLNLFFDNQTHLLSKLEYEIDFPTFGDTDGVRSVELHSNENLVVYIPAEKILFQGDLFYFDSGDPFPPKNRTAIMSFFAKWLRDNKLAPERIYSVHSHGFATMDHVNRVLGGS